MVERKMPAKEEDAERDWHDDDDDDDDDDDHDDDRT